MINKKYVRLGLILVLIISVLSLVAYTGIEKTRNNMDEGRVYCTENQRDAEMCTMQYDPVCGYKKAETKETYSNPCFACMESEVEYWISGEC